MIIRLAKTVFSLAVVTLMFSCLIQCSNSESPLEVDLGKREPVKPSDTSPGGKTFRIAIGGMITPREGFAYYRQLLDYIGEKMGRHIELVDRENYEEINNLLKTSNADAAFVCGGPYVDGRREFGMELVAAPVAYGEAVYYSYIIVARDSQIHDFLQLRGKRFAFTDPLSNSGKLVPTYMLAKMNETPDSFFEKYIFTRTHDNAIKAVSQGIVDGAAVDSLIWEYASHTNPKFTSGTRIIKRSPPYGIPPVVVRPGMSPELREKLKDILLSAHTDPKGREILQKMMIDKFIPIDDSAYDSIREMKEWLSRQDPGTGKD